MLVLAPLDSLIEKGGKGVEQLATSVFGAVEMCEMRCPGEFDRAHLLCPYQMPRQRFDIFGSAPEVVFAAQDQGGGGDVSGVGAVSREPLVDIMLIIGANPAQVVRVDVCGMSLLCHAFGSYAPAGIRPWSLEWSDVRARRLVPLGPFVRLVEIFR